MTGMPRCTECDDYVTSPYWVDEKSRPWCNKHATGKRQFMQVTAKGLNEKVQAMKERGSGTGPQETQVS